MSKTWSESIVAEIAVEFFKQWRECSIEMLKVLCPTCPPFPRGSTKHGKYRPWGNPGSVDGPVGLLYHFTGGPNGLASLRWGNENRANKNSSWHATVFDHRILDVAHILQKYPLVNQYLPVTALLHADIDKGTWHGNWTNSRCFGIENRNVGRLTCRGGVYGWTYRRRDGSSGFHALQSQARAVSHEGQWWEDYTVGQLIANINIGKMLLAWRGEEFDKRWVLPHSFIWASKSDTGSAFPMYWVRDAIWDPTPAHEIDWLQKHSLSLPISIVDSDRKEDEPLEDDGDRTDESAEVQEISPYEPMDAVDFDKLVGEGWRDFLPAVRENLTILGGCCEPPENGEDNELDADLLLATKTFQRSTWAKWSGPHKLKVDGIPGGKTREAIEARLRQFGYEV